MTWWMLLFGGLGTLLILLFLGLPIFIAFLVLNVGAVLILFGPAGFGLFANSIFSTATNSALATVVPNRGASVSDAIRIQSGFFPAASATKLTTRPPATVTLVCP